MSYKILLLDSVSPICGDVFKQRGFQVEQPEKMSQNEVESVIKDYHGVVVRSATKITRELLKKAPNLKIVGRAGVGVDNIDIAAATEQGVLVMNTPDGNTISTAEHTCGLILALARNIYNAVDSLKKGAWDRKKYMGTEIDGKVLGIIGLGKIGSNVATRMNAFGMKVIGYDPFTSAERAAEMGAELLSLDEVLAQSDFLTVHTPLTDKTRGMISKKTADKLKKGVRIVNCARGGIIEEADIAELLDSGVVAGMAIDVYSSEPPTDELYDLLKHPALITTPHLGASTEEAQEKVAEQMAHQMADALEMQNFKGSINGKAIALSANKDVQPFLKLAEQVGQFMAQVVSDNCDEVKVSYTGQCSKHSEVLTDSLLKGFMQQSTEDPVNLINARYLADQRGLKISELSSSAGSTFSDLITVDMGKGSYSSLAATIFGEGDNRVVAIDGYPIELKIEGDIVLYRNEDKPGMLASVSSALAQQNINIAALSLGRNTQIQDAVTALVVDKRLDEHELNSIVNLSGVRDVKYVIA